jgi:16S rRNA (uracil1498-N3)-methyltransferase
MACDRLQKIMSRFFAEILPDGMVSVIGEEAEHMARTLRMHIGDLFIALDGSEYEYTCEVTKISSTEVLGKILRKSLCPAEPKIRLTVYQAYPKAAKMETILQKCVELGISAFVPFISGRCVKRPEKDDAAKTMRLQRVAMEAVKQCARSRIPLVSTVLTMDEVINALPEHGLCLLAWEEERSTTLKQALRFSRKCEDIALIIGPEGGFSEEEAKAMTDAGATPVTLGKRILRTETAAMAVCAMVMYELEQ